MKRLLPVLACFLLLLLSSTEGRSADFQKGLDAYKSGDYGTAMSEWEPLAKDLVFNPLGEEGNARPQWGLGLMYENGHGVTQNYKTAVKWYKLSASQGYAPALTDLKRLQKKIAAEAERKRKVKEARLAAAEAERRRKEEKVRIAAAEAERKRKEEKADIAAAEAERKRKMIVSAQKALGTLGLYKGKADGQFGKNSLAALGGWLERHGHKKTTPLDETIVAELEKAAEVHVARLAAEADARRLADLKRKQIEADARRLADLKRKQIEAETRRLIELERKRKDEEARRLAESKRKRIEAEARRLIELERKRKEEEAQRLAEAERKEEEARLAAVEAERKRKVEEARLAEAERKVEEARLAVLEAERKRKAEAEQKLFAKFESQAVAHLNDVQAFIKEKPTSPNVLAMLTMAVGLKKSLETKNGDAIRTQIKIFREKVEGLSEFIEFRKLLVAKREQAAKELAARKAKEAEELAAKKAREEALIIAEMKRKLTTYKQELVKLLSESLSKDSSMAEALIPIIQKIEVGVKNTGKSEVSRVLVSVEEQMKANKKIKIFIAGSSKSKAEQTKSKITSKSKAKQKKPKIKSTTFKNEVGDTFFVSEPKRKPKFTKSSKTSRLKVYDCQGLINQDIIFSTWAQFEALRVKSWKSLPKISMTPCHYYVGDIKVGNQWVGQFSFKFYPANRSKNWKECDRDDYCETHQVMFKNYSGKLGVEYMIISPNHKISGAHVQTFCALVGVWKAKACDQISMKSSTTNSAQKKSSIEAKPKRTAAAEMEHYRRLGRAAKQKDPNDPNLEAMRNEAHMWGCDPNLKNEVGNKLVFVKNPKRKPKYIKNTKTMRRKIYDCCGVVHYEVRANTYVFFEIITDRWKQLPRVAKKSCEYSTGKTYVGNEWLPFESLQYFPENRSRNCGREPCASYIVNFKIFSGKLGVQYVIISPNHKISGAHVQTFCASVGVWKNKACSSFY
jgi:hypothetical protein